MKYLQNRFKSSHYSFPFCLCLLLVVGLYGCKDHSLSVDSQTKVESTNPTGTLTGVVIDKATSEPLPDVRVVLSYIYPDSSNEEQFIQTTDSSGRFVFGDIPANNNGNKFSFDVEDEETEFSVGSSSNYSYSLRLDMSNLKGYRAHTLFEDIRLNFESLGGLAGGAGTAEQLVSSVVLPVGKLNARIKGKVTMATTNEAVEEARVEAYLADGFDGFESAEDIMIKSGTTDASGNFELDALEESSKIYLRITKEIDSNNRINVKTSEYDLLASTEDESPLLDIGNITVSPVNSSSKFMLTGISVEDGSLQDPTDVEFVFNFNKPVKQTPYTATGHGFGVNSGTIIDDLSLISDGTRAKIGDLYEIDASWNEAFTQLTVTVIEDLLDGHKYTFDATVALGNLTDEEGAALFFNSSTTYPSLADAGTINFAAEGNASTPEAPQLFANYNEEVNYSGVAVELVSIVDESEVDVAYIEIYRKVGDEKFTRIEKVDDWFADQIRYNTSTGPLVKSRSGGTNYDSSVSISYKVRAVSINLRRSAFSDTITISDVMGPSIESAVYTTAGAPQGRAYIDISFSEPLKFSSMDSELFNASNYSFRDSNDETKTVTDVDVETYYFDTYQIRLEIPEGAVNTGSDKILVKPAIQDLAGNGVSQEGNDDEAVIQ